jgi:hypothetical protein
MTGRRAASEWGVVAALRDLYGEQKYGEGLQALGFVLARDVSLASLEISERETDLAADVARLVRLAWRADRREAEAEAIVGALRAHEALVVARVAALMAHAAVALAPLGVPAARWLWRVAGFMLGVVPRAEDGAPPPEVS